MSSQAKKVLIVATSGPGTPERCAAPFFFATSAAAKGHQVSIFFTMQATQLLKRGVSETICAKEGGRPVSQFMRRALDVGVTFFVCAASLELNGLSQDQLIDGADNLVGSVFLTERGLDSDLVLTF